MGTNINIPTGLLSINTLSERDVVFSFFLKLEI